MEFPSVPNLITSRLAGVLTCADRHDHGYLDVYLSWHPASPLEVVLSAHSREHGDVDKTLDRETLARAVSNQADSNYVHGTEGFYTIRTRRAPLAYQLSVRLYGPNASGDVRFNDILIMKDRVRDFLDRTLLVVGLGAEHVDVDGALARILES